MYGISIFLVVKRDVKRVLLRALFYYQLQSDLHQLESALKKLLKLLD